MLSRWNQTTLPELLAANGLDGVAEESFPNDGWSGARLTLLRRGSDRFVLKRTSLAIDWIARATRDDALREGTVASGQIRLPSPFESPYIGAAADGDAVAILMVDLSGQLMRWDRPTDQAIGDAAVDDPTLDRIIGALAALHATDWAGDRAETGERFPWCPVEERVQLLSPAAARRYVAAGLPVGQRFVAGWTAFDRLAPPAARRLIGSLSDDASPLLGALGRLPPVGLHGDVKLANVALMPGGGLALIDWQMASRAPVAVELGWFLVANVAELGEPPDAILERYRTAAGRAAVDLGDWSTQVDLAIVIGLLLRGWRKGIDADAGVTLPFGVTAADDLAWWCDRAVVAADRQLGAARSRRGKTTSA